MIKKQMAKKFKKILDKYGITQFENNSSAYMYNGYWILDYYGKDLGSKDCFALMTRLDINDERIFIDLERVRSDYTPKELDYRINELIVNFKKIKMKKKFEDIKEDFV